MGFAPEMLQGDADAQKILLNALWRLAEADVMMIPKAKPRLKAQNLFVAVTTKAHPAPAHLA